MPGKVSWDLYDTAAVFTFHFFLNSNVLFKFVFRLLLQLFCHHKLKWEKSCIEKDGIAQYDIMDILYNA